MTVLYDLAITATEQAGWSPTAIREAFYQANVDLAQKLAPTCEHSYPDAPGGQELHYYECEAYDGTIEGSLEWKKDDKWHIRVDGEWVVGRISEVQIQDKVTAHTSRRLARAAIKAREGH